MRIVSVVEEQCEADGDALLPAYSVCSSSAASPSTVMSTVTRIFCGYTLNRHYGCFSHSLIWDLRSKRRTLGYTL